MQMTHVNLKIALHLNLTLTLLRTLKPLVQNVQPFHLRAHPRLRRSKGGETSVEGKVIGKSTP